LSIGSTPFCLGKISPLASIRIVAAIVIPA
jgi:hypothetical protein